MRKKFFSEEWKKKYSGIVESLCHYVLAIVGWEIGKWLFF
jgi:hypothetical protein